MLFNQSKTCFMVTASVAVIFLISCFSPTHSAETYEAKCEQGRTNDGRVLDNCDSEKFLKCYAERCRCADQTHQIWTYRREKASNSRSRRSPKKGGSKGGSKGKIVAGVAAGAAGGYLLSSAVNNNHGTNFGSSSSSSSSRNGKNDNTHKVYGCYTRVHGECLLPGNEQGITVNVAGNSSAPLPVVIINSINNTSTDNITTTTSTTAPQALAQVSYSTEFVRLPKCVEHSICKAAEVKIVNGTVVSGSVRDNRIGICKCEDGYKPNNQDLCVKSGAGLLRSDMSIFVVLVSVLISKWM